MVQRAWIVETYLVDTRNNLNILFGSFTDESTYSRKLSPKTVKGYMFAFKRFKDLMPEVQTTEFLTSAMVTEFFKRLHIGRPEIKDSTTRSYWNKINPFFVWLVANKKMPFNPLESLVPPTVRYEDVRALTGTDIRKLYSAIVLHSRNVLLSRRDTAMLSMLVFCGIRLNEFVSLETSHLDLFNKVVTVYGRTSKSRKTRTIPMHPTLYFHLQEYLAERKKHRYSTELLFVSKNRDGGITKDGLKHWVNRLKRLTGVNCYVHRFRHTFACNLALNNVHAVKIQKLLGHSSLEMTMTYLRSIHTEDLKDDIQKLSF